MRFVSMHGDTMARKHISDFDVCVACRDAHRRAMDSCGEDLTSGFELLVERTGEHIKVVLASMSRACDRGLIDYGVSLETSWPTGKGLELIERTWCADSGTGPLNGG